jgi:6-bladed beta-propeller
MKACLTSSLLAMLLALLLVPAHAQQNVPDLPFDSVADFLKLPPGTNFGEVSGVAVNSKGHVFVFTRSNSAHGPAYAPTAAQLLEFGPKGEFIREIGKDLYGWSFAHTVRIDKNDNIWAVDKGSDMIIKFDPTGRVREVYGRRKESADDETKPWEHPNPPLPHVDGLFRQPTDVAWDSQGNTYITDGYVNSRVAKYDKNGDWVKSWGERGTGPGQFNLPHAIVIDREDHVYVGDRSNRRIQVFDTDGRFLRMFTIDVPVPPGTKPVNGNTPTGDRLAAVIGAPNSICITPGPSQVLFVGESTFPGRLFKVSLDGKVLGVIGKSGRQLKQFSGVHQLACPSETEVYAAETSNWRVQKLLLKPVESRTASAR